MCLTIGSMSCLFGLTLDLCIYCCITETRPSIMCLARFFPFKSYRLQRSAYFANQLSFTESTFASQPQNDSSLDHQLKTKYASTQMRCQTKSKSHVFAVFSALPVSISVTLVTYKCCTAFWGNIPTFPASEHIAAVKRMNPIMMKTDESRYSSNTTWINLIEAGNIPLGSLMWLPIHKAAK